jgi:hypothetical protein
MHTTKKEKKKTKKKKSRYGIPLLATTVQPPQRQHLKSRLSTNDISNKGTVHKRHVAR